MIVFLSDIHFSDETAGPPNVPSAAFAGVYKDLAKMARAAKAEKLEIVFLGDIFDLIRSTAWQEVDITHRPWSQDDGKWTKEQDQAAEKILRNIIKLNKKSIQVLKKSPIENTIRTFIPGNHDRIVNLSPALRKTVCDALKLNHNSNKRFNHFFASPNARTFARHGHEFDAFNFAGSKKFSQRKWVKIPQGDYDKTPIGDLLAAEISARLPDAVMQKLSGQENKYPELATRLKDLFDVRPFTAIPAFLSFQIQNFNDPVVTQAINEGFQQVVSDFSKLSYVKRYIKSKDRWYNPFDEADKLKYIMALGERFDLSQLNLVVQGYEIYLEIHKKKSNLASEAADDFYRLNNCDEFNNSPFEFVLYGHTHSPEQRLIDISGSNPNQRPRFYLNTGMWRPMHNQGLISGFASWHNLCYTVIYEPGELWKGGTICTHPMFEVWTGCLEQ